MRIENPLHFKGNDSEYEERYKVITENKKKYAEKHPNIDFEERNTRMKSGFMKDLRYQKTFFLREVLQSEKYSAYDYFVWMDADMAFMNCSISLIELIKEESINVHGQTPASDKLPDLVFSKDHYGVNNGIFAISNSEWSLGFVRNWTYPVESVWHKQVKKRCQRGICDQGMFIAILFGMDVYSKNYTMQQFKNIEARGFGTYMNKTSIPSYMQLMREDVKEHVAMIPRQKWNSYPPYLEIEYDEMFNTSEYNDGKNNNGFILHLTGTSKQELAMDEIITKESNC